MASLVITLLRFLTEANAISTASVAAEPPSYKLALLTSNPVIWLTSVSYSNMTCRLP